MPVSTPPTGEAARVTECIVGHSESGRHHVLESSRLFTQIIAPNGDEYVDLDAPTALRHRKTHQQHRELTDPSGAWRVIRKTEFDVRRMRPAPEEVTPPPPLRIVRD